MHDFFFTVYAMHIREQDVTVRKAIEGINTFTTT